MSEKPAEVVYVRRPTPYHIVKAGESITSIAQKYRMQEDALIRLNRIQAPYQLLPGQRLVVYVVDDTDTDAASSAVASSSTASLNVVKEGEVSVKPLGVTDLSGTEATSVATETVPVADATEVASAAPNSEGIGAELPSTEEDTNKELQSRTDEAAYVWPVQGEIIQTFGEKLKDGTVSDGIIISAPMNTKIKAAAGGVVRSAGNKLAAFGKMVVIKHADGKLTVYAHMNDIFVKQKAKIAKGEVIGTVGKTGIATRPQLYFQVRNAAPQLTPIDPTTVLP